MATIRHRINDYKVSTLLNRVGTTGSAITRTERTIVLTTEPLAHGITLTITLAFSNAFDVFTSPVVGYYMGRDTFTQRVTIWLPVREFPVNYDLLRNEKPVYYEFDFNDSGPLVNYITRFTLTTGAERPGEGGGDITKLMSLEIPERFIIQAMMENEKTPELTTNEN